MIDEPAGITFSAACVTRNIENSLMSKVFSNCSSVIASRLSQWYWRPALLTRMSRAPSSSATLPGSLRAKSLSRRSPGSSRALRPAPSMTSLTCWASCSSSGR